MAQLTRKIGLSLGADICWPICFEEILQRLQLEIPWQGDRVRFELDRVTIEPFERNVRTRSAASTRKSTAVLSRRAFAIWRT